MIEFPEMFLQLLLAALLGALIGFEREYRRKAAGLRTYTLVAIGSALFTLVSVYGFENVPGGFAVDPSRVAANIVVGIGFLGAGLIFHSRDNQVRGLTTAAGVWAVAALGMAVGLKMYAVAVFSTFVALAVLILFRFIENIIPRA